MSFVYLLISTNGNTYVGATINLERRLRQHNKEIKGGAKATSIQVSKGEIWSRVLYVSGFPNWKASLQFEWRWKQLSRKYSLQIKPLERRLKALHQLLSLEKPTSNAIPYTEWEGKPEIHFEMNNAEEIYNYSSS